jgi:tetratricopeptide (TPR) repeat protein
MSDRLVALVIALVLIAAPAVAAPADTKAEARRHFDAGVACAKQGSYSAALVEFTRAYQLSPSYAVLYNIGKAQEALGQPVEAVAAFERYLAEGGAAVPADRRTKVTAQLKELEAHIGTITIHAAPETATVYLDGAVIDAATAARGVRVNIGPHRVMATADGYVSTKREVDVERVGVFDVTLALAPIPPPAPAKPDEPAAADVPPLPPPPPAPSPSPSIPLTPPAPALQLSAPPPPLARAPDSGRAQRGIGYAVTAAGAAALIAGGVIYLVALSDRQKAIDAQCTAMTCMGQGLAYWHDAQNGVTWSRRAAIAGGVLVAGGLTVVLMAPSGRDAPAGLALGGRF